MREFVKTKQGRHDDQLAAQSARSSAGRLGEDQNEIADKPHEPSLNPHYFRDDGEQKAFNF